MEPQGSFSFYLEFELLRPPIYGVRKPICKVSEDCPKMSFTK